MTQHDTATSRTFLKVTLQESCNTEKDLGVWVPSGLTYEKQVPEQCAKDKKSLAMCTERLGVSKRVAHCILFLSSDAILATKTKYWSHNS